MKIEDLIGKRFYTEVSQNDVYKIEKVNGYNKVVVSFNGKILNENSYQTTEKALELFEKGIWVLIDEEKQHPSLKEIEETYKDAKQIKCARTGEIHLIEEALLITETNKGFYSHRNLLIVLYDKETGVFASIVIYKENKSPKILENKIQEYIHENDTKKRIEAFSQQQFSTENTSFSDKMVEISKIKKSVLPFGTDKEVDFDMEIHFTIQKIQQLLLVKGKEYRRNNNPYHNFEVAARKKNITPEKALDGFLLKHLVSYDDMLNDIEQGVLPKIEVVEEKFSDILVYFMIQKAQILNRIKNEKN